MDNPIKVTALVPTHAMITRQELGYAVMQVVKERTGVKDDAWCDWMTCWNSDFFGIYIGDVHWKVPVQDAEAEVDMMKMVDAANILINGHTIQITDDR